MVKSIFLKIIPSFLVSLFFIFIASLSTCLADFPQPVGYVNDFAGIIDDDFQGRLEQDLSDFEEETGVEIAVVTVKNLGDNYLENYAVELFEQWGIGQKKQDNGLLLLVALEEREVRIEVGYGLEPVITDSRSGQIIRELITPHFKEANYDQGIEAAVVRIQDYIRSGQSPGGVEEDQPKAESHFSGLIIGFMIVVWLAAYWSRTKRIWPGGLVSGLLGGFLSAVTEGTLVLGWVAGLGLWGLFLDWLLSKNYQKRKQAKKPTDFFKSWGGFSGGSKSSGSIFSGGRSGGGFGGFGGGRSGGGGASGSW